MRLKPNNSFTILSISTSKTGIWPISILLSFCLFVTPAISHELHNASKTLKIGIIPYLSARALIPTYVPLQKHLAMVLGRPVEIYSANNFRQFVLNARHGDYDLVISASHFARLLQIENNFEPILRFALNGKSLIVTSRTHPVSSLQALNHQAIAVPDKLALASIVAITFLKRNGLDETSNIRLLVVPSFTSAILAMQNGEAVAAVTAAAVLNKMPGELKDSVTVLADAGTFTNLIILASSSLDKREASLIRNSLLKLENDPAHGSKLINTIGFGSLITPTEKDMKQLDPYLPETRKLLENAE